MRRRADGTLMPSLTMQVKTDICSLCKRVRDCTYHINSGVRIRVCNECKERL